MKRRQRGRERSDDNNGGGEDGTLERTQQVGGVNMSYDDRGEE